MADEEGLKTNKEIITVFQQLLCFFQFVPLFFFLLFGAAVFVGSQTVPSFAVKKKKKNPPPAQMKGWRLADSFECHAANAPNQI